jgi:hypothetical protein
MGIVSHPAFPAAAVTARAETAWGAMTLNSSLCQGANCLKPRTAREVGPRLTRQRSACWFAGSGGEGDWRVAGARQVEVVAGLGVLGLGVAGLGVVGRWPVGEGDDGCQVLLQG